MLETGSEDAAAFISDVHLSATVEQHDVPILKVPEKHLMCATSKELMRS